MSCGKGLKARGTCFLAFEDLAPQNPLGTTRSDPQETVTVLSNIILKINLQSEKQFLNASNYTWMMSNKIEETVKETVERWPVLVTTMVGDRGRGGKAGKTEGILESSDKHRAPQSLSMGNQGCQWEKSHSIEGKAFICLAYG